MDKYDQNQMPEHITIKVNTPQLEESACSVIATRTHFQVVGSCSLVLRLRSVRNLLQNNVFLWNYWNKQMSAMLTKWFNFRPMGTGILCCLACPGCPKYIIMKSLYVMQQELQAHIYYIALMIHQSLMLVSGSHGSTTLCWGWELEIRTRLHVQGQVWPNRHVKHYFEDNNPTSTVETLHSEISYHKCHKVQPWTSGHYSSDIELTINTSCFTLTGKSNAERQKHTGAARGLIGTGKY